MDLILVNVITILSLAGFIISSYIYKKKKAKTKLVCPMRSNCDTVIHSDYSKILGVRVEFLGMIYYFLTGASYGLLYLTMFYSREVGIVLFGFSLSAVLFSIYLVSVQAFILKHWCAWCLSSA
jgi:uncharacterized membrane protein